jgi:hypothetical protein
VIPSLIAPDLIDYLQINKLRIRFSEDERDHYITKGEVCRIRKDVQRVDIQLDPNDAQSTRGWVDTLRSEGQFVYYKDKQDDPPEGSDLARDLFILCIQTKFQKEAYNRLGNAFLGIDATHNITQYKGILLFTLMARDHWGHGK